MQCEEVDLNDPKMDPLEWSVRKTISIPKIYYWETENYNVSFRTKVWHRCIQAAGMSLRGAERVGEVIANVLGVNASRFDDVTAFMTDEEWAQAEANAKRDKEKRQAYLKEKESQKDVV